MVLYNATDVPIELRGKVLLPGRSVSLPEVKVEGELTVLERRSIRRGLLTTYWPAPVSRLAKNCGPGVQQLQNLYHRF